MFVISIKQLLEAGVHFGHPTKKWNPKMQEYIFTARNGIHIIDLQKTVKKFEEAYAFVKQVSEEGGSILFVGTKKQAADSIKEDAKKCNELPCRPQFAYNSKSAANAHRQHRRTDTQCHPQS